MMVACDCQAADAARDALIASQGQLIAMLAMQNAALAGRAGELEERLARLERATSRNSGNSSLPPSLDDQPGRTPPPGKPQPGKRGHPRLHLHRRQARISAFTALRDALTGNPWMPPPARQHLKSARRQSRHATKANSPHKQT
jgi:hypothetical protein